MTVTTLIGVILATFAALASALLGMAGAIGQEEAMAQFAGFRELLAVHWTDIMLLGPALCTTVGAVGGMLVAFGAVISQQAHRKLARIQGE